MKPSAPRVDRPALHAATLAGIGARLDQVEREMGVKLPARLLQPQAAQFDGLWAVQACRRLRVDPRWLLLGIRSRAAAAVILHVTANCRSNGFGRDDGVIRLLEMLPELVVFRRTCRYCGCTENRACQVRVDSGIVGCAWLDDERTICSACLEVVL